MTTSLKTVLALATVIAIAPALAHADQTPGWYIGAGIGGNISPDESATTIAGKATLKYNPSLDLEASGGYSWNDGLRSELELFHSQSDIDSIKNGVSHGGHLTNNDLFGNVLYDFHTGTVWTPYVGAGVGLALVDAKSIGGLSNASYLKGNNAEFAYQAIAGVAAQLDPNWAITADYRYIATPDPKFHDTDGRGVYTGNESHNILVGLRYSFDEPAAPVQPVHASAPVTAGHAPAAKPSVSTAEQSYTVFFDFNKSDLTPEAKRIIASAAQDYKGGHYVRIVVTGHTDTVGSEAYNQKLSEKRAASIKAEFKKLGVDVSKIKTAGVGKNGLLVPTQDGVREAQNRRGEIVFDKK